jgi:hypothetical protein
MTGHEIKRFGLPSFCFVQTLSRSPEAASVIVVSAFEKLEAPRKQRQSVSKSRPVTQGVSQDY